MDNKNNTNNTNIITNKNTNSGFKGFFGSETVQLSETIANLVMVLVAFYGILYVSQVSSIFTCQQNRINDSHPIYKYIFTFGIFYFVAIVVSKDNTDIPPIQKFINCLFYFVIFIIFNRLDYRLTMVVLGLVFLLYFIFLNKQYYYSLNPNTNIVSAKSSSNNQTSTTSTTSTTTSATTNAFIQDHQYWITYDFPIRIRVFKVKPEQFYYITLFNHIIIVSIIIIIIFGFVNYIGLLKYTYHNKIDMYNIFIHDSTCIPLKYGLGFFQYVLLAINYDYYIKKFKPVKL